MSAIAEFWDDAIVPKLVEYIAIPAKSPHFDKDWSNNGHIDAAVKLAEEWCRRWAIEGMKMEVVSLTGRTPLLFIEEDSALPPHHARPYGFLRVRPEDEQVVISGFR